jgi:hypothetical protein
MTSREIPGEMEARAQGTRVTGVAGYGSSYTRAPPLAELMLEAGRNSFGRSCLIASRHNRVSCLFGRSFRACRTIFRHVITRFSIEAASSCTVPRVS